MEKFSSIEKAASLIVLGGILFLGLFAWNQRAGKEPAPVEAVSPESELAGSANREESAAQFSAQDPGNLAGGDGRSDLRKGLRNLDEIPVLTMASIDTAEKVRSAETLDKKRGRGVFRFAEPIEVEITPENSGIWGSLPGGGAIWRTRVASPGAESLNLAFLKYRMPEGGRLSIYPPENAENRPIRDFTAADNEAHGQLWTPIIQSDELAIEVVLPAGGRELLALTLSKVNHGFRGLRNYKIGGDTTGACNVDVACTSDPTVGALVSMFSSQIRSVGAYTLEGVDACSGALINNTNNDGKPYFLTAEHCGIDPGNAPSMVVFFNFQNSTCRTPGSTASGGVGDGDLSQFNSGAIHRAESAASDFCLVELDDPIPGPYNVFFAGWDRSGANGPVAGIHHPAVAEKRISFELDNTVDDGSTHVEVTDWDHGTTEGGSSGSPLFDFNGRIIGDLTGGDADCGNNLGDSYGRLSVSWIGGGSTATRLSDWLDPAGTNPITLDGINQDDALSIEDAVITEGDSSTQTLSFTVNLFRTSNDTVTVQYQTFNDTAASGSDYATTNGTLTFIPGDSEETIDVTVNGDTTPEEHETFEVRLSNPANGLIAEGTGIGTINNDDFIPPVITSPLTSAGFDGVPFTYQITANHTPTGYSISSEPAGMMVNGATGEISWTPSASGPFTVTITATNPAGSDSKMLTIDVAESDLKEALDTTLNFTEGADRWFLQTAETHDGVDAARSPAITHGQTAFFETQITAPPQGDAVNFWWKVSSEADFDFLRFFADGVLIDEISGAVDWVEVIHPLAGSTTTTLRWEYTKDGSDSEGLDAGFVDELSLASDDPLPSFISSSQTTGQAGEPFFYDVDAFGASSYSAVNLPAGLEIAAGTGEISGVATSLGTTVATITATNGSGARDQPLTIEIVPSLTGALEIGPPQVTWSLSGDAVWFSQTGTSHDGVDAAESGNIDDSEQSILQADVNFDGAQILSFWWKVSSEEDYDFLTFNIGVVENDFLSGEVDWVRKSGISIPAGPRTLTWVYEKDGSQSEGSDAGWLDEVEFSYKLAAPASFSASQGTSLNAVRLSWAAVPSATEYRVFRSTSNDFATATPVTTVSSNTQAYDDTGATPGIQYFYWIRAFNTTDQLGAAASTSGFITTGLDQLIINEIEADDPGTDNGEFIEIFDGGAGGTALTGVVVVFYDGATNRSYRVISLSGQSTDANGYFVIGNAGVPGVGVVFADGLLQNGDAGGSDAVALYVGTAGAFPNGSAVTTQDLIDAVVYKTTGQPDDPALAPLLNGGEPQLDDDSGGNEAGHSLQRFPNGAGGARNTGSYAAMAPTPGAANELAGAPSIPDLAAASDLGTSPTDDLTSDATPTFTGTARAGALVTVSTGAADLGTAAADSTGTWTFTPGTALTEGPHAITATADKHTGGGTSSALTVTIDLTPPPAPTALDLNAGSDSGISPTDDITNLNTLRIDGEEAAIGVTVTLASSLSGDVGSAVVNSPWFIVTPALPDGLHEFTARAADAAGNSSSDSAALSVRIDRSGPAVGINRAAGQVDPAEVGPVTFAALFSEPVHGFETGDVVAGGTAGATAAVVSGGPANFDVSVSGADREGTVTIAIAAGVATDAAGNPNSAGLNNDNSIDLDRFGGTAGTATVLAFTGSTAGASGALFAGDMDFFEITLARPSQVTVRTTGTTDTKGSIFDASGTLLNNPAADADRGDGGNLLSTRVLSAGTHRVKVEGQTGVDTGLYDLEIVIDREVTFQPDLLIGKKPGALLGGGIHNSSGAGQSQKLVSKKLRKVNFHGRLENDGGAADSFVLRGNRKNKSFKVKYFDGAGNATAEMIAGSRVRPLGAGAGEAIRVQVIPSKKLKNRRSGRIKRKKFTTMIAASSRLSPGKVDGVSGLTQTK